MPPMIERGRRVRWVARARALPGNVRGALWMLLAAMMFSAAEALIKALGRTIDSFEIAFFRCFLGGVFILPFMMRAGVSALRTQRLGGHLLRAGAGYAATATAFYALTHLPLADATALSFARPLFVVILAVLFLGEPVRWRRWTATAVGFGGVLVMARPDGAALDIATIVALVSAFFVAVVTVAIKRLAETERPETIIFYFATVSSLLSIGPALYVWRTPTAGEFALLLLMGALGSIGQYFTIRSFRIAEATAVDPVDYTRLLLATLIGIAVFAEVPDLWTLLGAAIIVASTLYITRREARLGRAVAAGPPAPARV
jgi:drug/metabolite transporter (DMT)-like permease